METPSPFVVPRNRLLGTCKGGRLERWGRPAGGTSAVAFCLPVEGSKDQGLQRISVGWWVGGTVYIGVFGGLMWL